jgi:hypothetical protein
MKTTRRTFLQTSALATIGAIGPTGTTASGGTSVAFDKTELDGYEIAGRHPLVRTKPGPTYFEGMLLGNGDIGLCAVVRPDALGLHISKSDCWDIRVTEGSENGVRPYAEILEMWKRASEELKQKGYKSGDSVENADFFGIISTRSAIHIQSRGRALGHAGPFGSNGTRDGSSPSLIG